VQPRRMITLAATLLLALACAGCGGGGGASTSDGATNNDTNVLLGAVNHAAAVGGPLLLRVASSSGQLGGSSTYAGYTGWIPLRSLSINSKNTGHGVATFGTLDVSKDIDSVSPRLALLNWQGAVLPKVEAVVLISRADTTWWESYRIALEGSIITSWAQSAEDGVAGVEKVSFAIQKISLTSRPLNSDGTPGSPVSVAWDAVSLSVRSRG